MSTGTKCCVCSKLIRCDCSTSEKSIKISERTCTKKLGFPRLAFLSNNNYDHFCSSVCYDIYLHTSSDDDNGYDDYEDDEYPEHN